MSLNGKTAVVTGASRGIGRAIAAGLAQQGANIVFSDIVDEEKAQETIDLCKKHTENVLYIRGDVSNSDDVKSLMDTANKTFGSLDILVCNAGITRDNLAVLMKEQDFDDVISTNLKGTFLCAKFASKIMMRQKYGRIICISSIVGVRGNAGQANYSASKAGVIGITKSLAKELAVKNITANAIAPGFIQTDMTDAMPEKAREDMISAIPAKRLGTGEDIADAVAFLASDAASYITGQVLCVDGGLAV